MNTICSRVSRSERSQQEIAHVVVENIWVINITLLMYVLLCISINITIVDMLENRQVLPTMWIDIFSTLLPLCVSTHVGRYPTKHCGHYPLAQQPDD